MATLTETETPVTVPDERDPKTGRFTRGNLAGLKNGLRSAQVANREVMVAGQKLFVEGMAAARAELEEELGAGRALSTLQRGIVQRYLEQDAIATFLARRMLAEGGPLTAKGQTRSYLDHYLKVVDRQAKLAAMLGLRAPEKQIVPGAGLPSKDAYRAPVADDDEDGDA